MACKLETVADAPALTSARTSRDGGVSPGQTANDGVIGGVMSKNSCMSRQELSHVTSRSAGSWSADLSLQDGRLGDAVQIQHGRSNASGSKNQQTRGYAAQVPLETCRAPGIARQ